jgi:hypothetical protein
VFHTNKSQRIPKCKRRVALRRIPFGYARRGPPWRPGWWLAPKLQIRTYGSHGNLPRCSNSPGRCKARAQSERHKLLKEKDPTSIWTRPTPTLLSNTCGNIPNTEREQIRDTRSECGPAGCQGIEGLLTRTWTTTFPWIDILLRWALGPPVTHPAGPGPESALTNIKRYSSNMWTALTKIRNIHEGNIS